MKVIKNNGSATIYIKSRLIVFADDTVTLFVREEGCKEEKTIENVPFTDFKNYLKLAIDATDLVVNRTYEFTVVLNSTGEKCYNITMYKGRFLVVDDLDVQDFKRTEENNDKLYL